MTTPPLSSFADIHTHGDARADAVRSIEPSDHIVGDYGSAWYSVGIHPWSTDRPVDEATFRRLETMAADPRVVAIGEAGLDALRGGDKETQERVFLRHVEISEKAGKPLIIHCVRRYGRLLELHGSLHPTQPWIVHGFAGKPELAHQLTAAGIGVSLRSPRPDIAAVVPRHLLFTETD